jgi:hypothetical protein
MNSIEVIFAEFNGKFQPNIGNIRAYFPDSTINLVESPPNSPKFDKSSPYWGYYMNDYWKVKKLLNSNADIAIAFDADMKIVSENVKAIIPLVKKFGLCLPASSRGLVKIDTEIGSHSDGVLDETLGMGQVMNMTPIAFHTENSVMRNLLEEYCAIMVRNPVRGPLNMWRAVYKTGIIPYLLPHQWCVCAEDVGIGSEIILHVGHKKVRDYYEKLF